MVKTLALWALWASPACKRMVFGNAVADDLLTFTMVLTVA